MSTLKVGAIRGVSASSDAITVANDGTCTAKITNKSNRNLVINGAMQVAQRGTASTVTEGYGSCDRFKSITQATMKHQLNLKLMLQLELHLIL